MNDQPSPGPGERGAVEEPAVNSGTGGAADDVRDATPAHGESAHGSEDARFRTTLTRVLAVQVVTLVLLWLIQATWNG